MRLQVWSLALLSGLGIRPCHELWCRLQMWLGSMLLWLWCGPAATALIWPLAWEPRYAGGVALKRQNNDNNNNTNELIYKTNRSTDFKNKIIVTRGRRGIIGSLGLVYAHCRIWNGQSTETSYIYIAQGTLHSIFCGNLCGKRIWKRMDTRICIIESLCYTAEINITL